jgi:acetyl-CoA carboxylase biotin carboxyl carrier protein
MSFTARDIAEITRLLEDSSFDELELEVAGMKIHLRRGEAAVPRAGAPVATVPAAAARAGAPAAAPMAAAAPQQGLVEVRAPLLGTFYRAPRPGAAAFVEPGTIVEPDSIIGIIEVMKLMNTVRAGARGVVREICAADATLVEYGAPLVRLEPRGGD